MSERPPGSAARRLRAAVAALLLAWAPGAAGAASPCRAEAGGIGGTGALPATPARPPKPGDDSGVGGTGRAGAPPEPAGARRAEEGGVGGTGIVGVITGFGSVCLNGLEVEIDAATRIEADGEPASAAALAVGQLVVVDAAGAPPALRAERVAVRHAAVGPVAEVDAARGELVVLGQRARLGRDARVHDAQTGVPMQLAELGTGQFVELSGLRDADGTVQVTRLARVAPRPQVSVSGPLEVTEGGLRIGGLAIEASRGGEAGRSALVVGRFEPATRSFTAERIEPAVRFAPGVERVSIEALVQERQGARLRTELADVDASRAPGARSLARGQRVVMTGTLLPDGGVRADRVERVAPGRDEGSAAPAKQRAGGEGGHSRDAAEDRRGSESAEKPEHPEAGEKPDEVEKPEKPEQPETAEKPEKPEKPETPEAPEKPETPEHVETPERPEAVERPEVERPEPVERPEVERPEPVERPEVERPEPIERPEIERPEPIERPEVERPEPVERPELPEIHDD